MHLKGIQARPYWCDFQLYFTTMSCTAVSSPLYSAEHACDFAHLPCHVAKSYKSFPPIINLSRTVVLTNPCDMCYTNHLLQALWKSHKCDASQSTIPMLVW